MAQLQGSNILVPSGELTLAIENGPVEIVDFPMKNGDFPLLCKRSPEGTLLRVSNLFYS